MIHKDLCQTKLQNDSALKYGEFYHLLKDLKKSIKRLQKDKETNIKSYNKFITIFNHNGNIVIETNRAQILNASNENSLIYVLTLMFGDNFYQTDEFNYIFKNCYNLQIPNQMYFTSKPNSLEDTRRLLTSIRTILNSNNIETICKVSSSLNILAKTIEQSALRVFTMSQEIDYSYKAILNILNACDKDEIINLPNLDYLRDVFNRNIFFENVKSKEPGELKVGDCLIDFINGYNENITPLGEEKNYNKQLKDYYRKITKIKFDKLENSDLPSYDDPNFLKYMRDLLLELETEPTKDAEYCKRYAIASMHYGLYFRR